MKKIIFISLIGMTISGCLNLSSPFCTSENASNPSFLSGKYFVNMTKMTVGTDPKVEIVPMVVTISPIAKGRYSIHGDNKQLTEWKTCKVLGKYFVQSENIGGVLGREFGIKLIRNSNEGYEIGELLKGDDNSIIVSVLGVDTESLTKRAIPYKFRNEESTGTDEVMVLNDQIDAKELVKEFYPLTITLRLPSAH